MSRVGLAKDPTTNVGVAWLVRLVRTATKLAIIAVLAKAVTVIALAAPVRVIMTWTVSRGAPAARLASLFGVQHVMTPMFSVEGCVSSVSLHQISWMRLLRRSGDWMTMLRRSSDSLIFVRMAV